MIENTSDLEQRIVRPAAIFICLGLVLKIVLMRLGPVHWDTNYYLNIGSNFIERGELTPYMWRLGADTNIIAGSGTGYGILLLTYWFKFVGLSMLSGYILMYLFGLVNLVLVYFVTRDWWGGRVAGVGAAVFMALTGSFASQYYIRMDAPGLTAYLLILWLYLYALRSGHNWLHFAVGVALVLAAEVHMMVLLYIGGFSLYYFLEHLQTFRQQRRLWQMTPAVYYFAGLGLAGIVHVLVHVVPNVEAYFIISRECPNCDPRGVIKEIRRYMLWIDWYGEEVLLLVMAVALAWIRRTAADKRYLILVAGFLIAMEIISPPGGVPYITHLLPLISIGVGGAWMLGTGQPFNRNRLVLGIFIACYLVAARFVTLVVEVTEFNRPEAVVIDVDYVRDYVPKDTVVMGQPPVYHNIIEWDRFLSYRDGDIYGVKLRDEDYPTFWAREKPEVFVGVPEEDDMEWWRYMHDHDFRLVREDIWVAVDLLTAISADYPAPEFTYSADVTRLKFGECAHLEWSVIDADAVELNDDEVEATGTADVCPPITTDYTLSVLWAGGTETQTITVQIE